MGNNPTFTYPRESSFWQVDKLTEFFRYSLLSTKIFFIQDTDLKLVQVGEFQSLLKDAKMQFVFKDRSLGFFFLRTKEQDQSLQAGKMGPSPSSMQSSTSQTSTCTTNPQVCSPQWSMNPPYIQSSFYPQPSLSQTSSWMTNPQIGPTGSMIIPCTQPEMQGALDSSQLTLEDVDQISAETWEQLNVIHSRCIYRYSSRVA